MNQDQARRWAEEVELPPINPNDHPDNQVLVWTASEIRAIERIRREAIAAALVKLTQEESVGWISSNTAGNNAEAAMDCDGRYLPEGTKLYTHPIPSQQEDRKPQIVPMEHSHIIK